MYRREFLMAMGLSLAAGSAVANAAAVQLPGAPAEPKKFTPDNLDEYDVAPWYCDAKLGVFMHLSAFTVPAYQSEWYASSMYSVERAPEHKMGIRKYHERTYGSLKEFGYKDFIPQLTMEKFDADYYAELVKASGAEYFAAPAIHHDGFAMWDSNEIKWNAMEMGPKRDVVRELLDAMKKKGIKTGVSTHHGRHWKYYNFRPEFDNWDPAYEGLYGKRRKDNDPPRPEDALQWERVMKELIDNYQPDYTFIDGGVCDALVQYDSDIFHNALYRFAAHYYNQSRAWNKDVVLSWKRNAMKEGEAVHDTEGGRGGVPSRHWQAHMKVKSPGWCYTQNEKPYPVDGILRRLVDIVSRNGNLLLNIGPKADGTLPKAQENVLLEIGKWMKVNREGIAGSSIWKVYGVGEINGIRSFEEGAVRFTQKDGKVYAYFMTWPADGKLMIPGITDKMTVKKVSLLGSNEKLEWDTESKGLQVKLPGKKPCEYLWCLRIN